MHCTFMWKKDLCINCYNYKSLPTCHTCTVPCKPGWETWVGHTLRMFHFSNENTLPIHQVMANVLDKSPYKVVVSLQRLLQGYKHFR